MTRHDIIFAIGLSALLACQGSQEGTASNTTTMTQGEPTSSTGEATSSAASTSTADSSAGTEPTTAGETTGGTAEPATTSDGSTGTIGNNGECDPIAQDCPDGLKCTAVAAMEGVPWNANKCVPVGGDGLAGDQCDVEGGKYTGVDDCAEGLLCMLTDQDGEGGVCIEFCDAGMNCPMTGASCEVYNEGILPICLPACSPLLQDCPEGQACYQGGSTTFVCFKEVAMPGKGGQGTPCQSVNICQKGFHCAAAALLPECPGEGCCTAFCALSEGDGACPDATMCLPFFAEGEAPPEYQDVGVCSIPQ